MVDIIKIDGRTRHTGQYTAVRDSSVNPSMDNPYIHETFYTVPVGKRAKVVLNQPVLPIGTNKFIVGPHDYSFYNYYGNVGTTYGIIKGNSLGLSFASSSSSYYSAAILVGSNVVLCSGQMRSANNASIRGSSVLNRFFDGSLRYMASYGYASSSPKKYYDIPNAYALLEQNINRDLASQINLDTPSSDSLNYLNKVEDFYYLSEGESITLAGITGDLSSSSGTLNVYATYSFTIFEEDA